ncbi:MAG TPA: PLDc N-terminal domain-containing protein [Actinomycetota bacterium]|nr:PLDc N-terminal domain-containing protein [Actinomycetota bacterium]
MVYARGLGFALFLLLQIYCVFDVIRSDNTLIRELPKIVWLLLVVLLGPIGCVAWLLLGRPERAAFMSGGPALESGPPARQVAPDDSPEFLRKLDEQVKELRRREEDVKRREEELRRREEEEGRG